MTPSGRFVAFVVGIPGTRSLVWDSTLGATVFTNATTAVNQLAISPDGNLIAYATAVQLRIANSAAQTDWMVGVFASLVGPRFSADGKWLAYTRLVSPWQQTFLYDVQHQTAAVASHAIDSGSGGGGNSKLLDLSPDGRFVAYVTTATNIIAGANGFMSQIVLYDRLTGLNRAVSASRFTGAPADDHSLRARFSADGQSLSFQSWASDLVAGDFNRTGDVFVHPIFTAAILPPGGGPGPWLYWPFVPGNNYEVQFKNNPEDSVWQTLPGTYTTNGVKAWMQDASPTSGQRVYRINSF